MSGPEKEISKDQAAEIENIAGENQAGDAASTEAASESVKAQASSTREERSLEWQMGAANF